MKRRRILIASYHFPPTDAVGGLRIGKFARFLPDFGWDPVILTIRDELRENGLDLQRLRGLEALPIYRTRELPRVFEGMARMTAPLRRQRQENGTSIAASTTAASNRRESVRQRIKRYTAALVMNLPDYNKNWSTYATASAIRLIRRHAAEWIFTSGPPFSTHMIGLAAKSLTNVRWAADFRDPWIDMLDDRDPELRCSLSDRMERAMESSVVNRADRVLTTTERMRHAMLARYAGVARERFAVIPNSIDTEVFAATPATSTSQPLTIVYAGSLYFDRTPEPLFRAIRQLLDSQRATERNIRLRLVGQCDSVGDIQTRDVIGRYGLERVVELLPVVPYAEAVRMMRQADLLLVLAPQRHRLVVPAKVYDYLGSGTPILAIAEPGATADLIAVTHSGACFSEHDTEAIADHIAAMLRVDRTRIKNDPSAYTRFDARHLTRLLASEMESAEGPRAAHASS